MAIGLLEFWLPMLFVGCPIINAVLATSSSRLAEVTTQSIRSHGLEDVSNRSFSLFFGGVRGSLCRRRYLIRRFETGKDTQEADPRPPLALALDGPAGRPARPHATAKRSVPHSSSLSLS